MYDARPDGVEKNRPTPDQRKLYEYYKLNPDSLTYHDLVRKARTDFQLHDYTRELVVKMLYHQHTCKSLDEERYALRQYDIMLTKYLQGFNVSHLNTEILFLQGQVDSVKRAVWANASQEITAIELADLVHYCYSIANLLNINLDEAIFLRMDLNKREEQRKQDKG